ncbi:protein EXORDIUM-like 1 [Selaginella moellendorffii]|nr:protein EXORDIUM-like 1 [Selaginella moellendorffii]|eukprot:XP_002960368.2 protein EXORDIUM-like 1 [Selaginella moellendorffii]
MASTLLAALAFLSLFAMAAQSKLVETPPLVLDYHNGPVLSGPEPIKIYLVLYGRFSKSDKATITDFLSSFSPAAAKSSSTVAKWWSLTQKYTDSKGQGVAQSLVLAKQATDRKYSLGKSLKKSDIATLVASSIRSKAFPSDPRSIYLVLTAADVSVQGFCQNTCGEHLYTFPGSSTGGAMLPYAWVGNSEAQCPGFCAWPYAKPQFGPQEVLTAPNGVGVDGMIITIAKVLAGAATNPFGTAYYQGEQTFALEAAGACSSSYGPGSYPGYPGQLSVDPSSKASYNVEGVNQRKFLVPWIWNPATLSCAGQP